MPDDRPRTAEDHSPGSTLFRFTFALGLAFMLYALSPGPVAKCLRPRTFNAFLAPSPLVKTVAIAYSPLGYFYDHSTAVRRFYDWYINDVWRAGP